MTKREFKSLCEKKIILLDGATGTNLQKAGMPTGVCPEQWILENKEKAKKLQIAFLEAGTDILYAPTFSANRIKLKEYGLQDKLAEMNRELVALSKDAVAEFEEKKRCNVGRHFIAGDLTMTGELVYPIGKLQFEELVDIYKEQVQVLCEAGVDLFVVETMMSLQECRAAVLAVKETCNLPVMVTLTFAGDNKTMYGTTPEAAVVVLQALGADAVGVNCSAGPETMVEIIKRMAAVAEVPVIAKPNAGMPELSKGKTVYKMTPKEFAKHMEVLVEAGAGIVGGCCGSEPAHIAAVSELIKKKKPQEGQPHKAILSTERDIFPIELDGQFKIIGERINPTGKKALQAELKEGRMDLVLQYAKEQEEAGAYILDVNAGMPGIDEKERLLQIIYEVTQNSSLPLAIDSSHVDVIEEALRIYPGRALVNSVSCEKEKMEKLLPIVKKYGAMFILLPLSEAGLPKDQFEKRRFIHMVMTEALKEGLEKEDIIVDGLVNTIGAGKNAALETLATIRYCREDLGLATSIGLSNISFGLPARSFVNTAFLTMAIGSGLTMAIANPCQKMTMQFMLASDLLMGKEGADLAFIEASADMVVPAGGAAPVTGGKIPEMSGQKKESTGESDNETDAPLFHAVLKGNKRNILELTKNTLDNTDYGVEKAERANKILNKDLIPAINKVGELFEQKKYFLPQLIASAETMELAMEVLEPLLAAGDGKKRGKVIIATVKGDIHDIGKNLVSLMLKNYGFDVIDMGKDVESEAIIEKAKETGAELIALSALMTTTMTRMKEVVDLKNAEGLSVKIIIGGAVTTEDYAKEIGADGYAKDAGEAVKVAISLTEQ
ncbi:MAG: homocysteine S-methyltransferase family protein [Lachnospiraceae bacterium]|nr:homocysteine S-methyltransferase family protein [Lachnospiraceae bacterium]